jgi:hypothetical protein
MFEMLKQTVLTSMPRWDPANIDYLQPEWFWFKENGRK